MIDLGGDVTGNGVSRLVFTILSAVAEAERDRIRERIADVKRDQRSRGRFLGGRRPFGYRVTDEGVLEPCEEEPQGAFGNAEDAEGGQEPARHVKSLIGVTSCACYSSILVPNVERQD